MDQDFDIGLRLIAQARENRSREDSWLLYCSIYPHFTEDNFVPFSEFCKPNKGAAIGRKTGDILKDVNKLRNTVFNKKAGA
jgi:hypothetical protein